MSRARSAKKVTLGALALALTATFGGCGDEVPQEPAIETTSAPVLCLDKNCDDGDPCTVDLCVALLCVNTPIDLCCEGDEDCSGGTLCELPKCLLGVCVLEPILGCNQGGSGGSSGNGNGGSSGSAGSSSSGGGSGSAGSGGSSGSGGSTAGAAGVAGSDGGEGGMSGQGGSDGEQGGESNGGSAGEGGGAGAEGGGSGDGGSAATGSGGKADGGSNTNGGSGGDTSTGGAGSGATSAGGTVNKSSDGEWSVRGGSCAVSPPSPTWPGAPFAVSLLALLSLVRRRNEKRAALGRTPKKGLALGASALLLFVSERARADGANSDRYTAPAAPEDLLWSERASPSDEPLKPFVRVSASFADDPLVLENENTNTEIALIDEQLGFHFSVGAALGGRVVASLLLPVYVQSTSSVAGFAQPDEGGIGNPGVDARFAVLERGSALELALAATLRVPIGNSETLAADDSFSVWPRALATVPFSRRTYLNLGVGPLLRGSEDVGDLELGSELRSVGGVHVGLTEVFGLTAEATVTTLFDDFFGSRKTPIEAMGGARFESGAWVAGVGAGAGLNEGYGSPDFRALASLAFQALAPEPPPKPAQEPLDTDRDGVADLRDRCVNEAEDFDRYEDDDGCPDLDNDRDRIADAKDTCPNEAEDADGFQDDDGCPDLDNDEDELVDLQDRCPDQAEDFDSYQDDDGCPEGDNDQDGLADAQDQCPNEAETKNGVEDDDGCPDFLRVEVDQIRTLEPIYFEYNRGKLQRRSEPLLLEMAELILARPDLGVISIEGHTDSQGPDKYNQKLSQARADAVRTFLIGAGVPEARLAAAGYGESRPLFDNESTGGRAKNRRVEFRFDPLDPEKSGGVASTKDAAP